MTVHVKEAEPHIDFAANTDNEPHCSPVGWSAAGKISFAALMTYAVVRSLAAALSKPLWNDELCTWIMAHLQGPSALWAALGHAADGNPPGFYLIEMFFSRLVANELIGFRIAPLIGYCCVLICVFTFIKRRSGDMQAVFCTAILLVTAIDGFPAEARPYSLVIACISVAMVCYQCAPSISWMILMGLSLAASQALHYYAIFAFIPFFVAETLVFLNTKKFRLAVWLALLAGFVPLVAFWPLLSAFRKYMGPHFWSQPSLLGITQTYGEFLHVPPYWGIAVFAVAAFGVFAALFSGIGRSQNSSVSEVPFQEYVLVLGLLGLPFAVFVITRLAHGGMTERYSLPTILGIPIAVSYILRQLDRKAVALIVAFVVSAIIFQELAFWQSAMSQMRKPTLPTAAVERLVGSVGHSDLPVVISAGINYLAINHYASAAWKSRFAIIVDRQKEIANTGSDSLDAQLLVLREYTPLQAYNFSTFVSKYPAFLLYSHKNAPLGDWWPAELVRDGYSMQLLAVDQSGRIYLVNASNESEQKLKAQLVDSN